MQRKALPLLDPPDERKISDSDITYNMLQRIPRTESSNYLLPGRFMNNFDLVQNTKDVGVSHSEYQCNLRAAILWIQGSGSRKCCGFWEKLKPRHWKPKSCNQVFSKGIRRRRRKSILKQARSWLILWRFWLQKEYPSYYRQKTMCGCVIKMLVEVRTRYWTLLWSLESITGSFHGASAFCPCVTVIDIANPRYCLRDTTWKRHLPSAYQFGSALILLFLIFSRSIKDNTFINSYPCLINIHS